jgi:hypothetical protein
LHVHGLAPCDISKSTKFYPGEVPVKSIFQGIAAAIRNPVAMGILGNTSLKNEKGEKRGTRHQVPLIEYSLALRS